MKYLQDYMDAAQSAAFAEFGAFFAFSQKQFDEAAVAGVRYASAGHGLIVPSEHHRALIDRLETIATEAIAQDIADHGIDAIIERELGNYECWYTGDYSDALSALEDYGVTDDQVRTIFYSRDGGEW